MYVGSSFLNAAAVRRIKKGRKGEQLWKEYGIV